MIVTHPAGILSPSDEGEGTFVTEQDTLQAPANNGAEGLGSLKLAQLRNLASQLGITGTSRMRKAQLVDLIADHQRGGSVADRQAVEEAKAAAATERKPRTPAAKDTKDADSKTADPSQDKKDN